MQARAEEGDVSGALRAYKALWDMLDEEYDMEPSAHTQELVAKIKTGDVERSYAFRRRGVGWRDGVIGAREPAGPIERAGGVAVRRIRHERRRSRTSSISFTAFGIISSPA